MSNCTVHVTCLAWAHILPDSCELLKYMLVWVNILLKQSRVCVFLSLTDMFPCTACIYSVSIHLQALSEHNLDYFFDRLSETCCLTIFYEIAMFSENHVFIL